MQRLFIALTVAFLVAGCSAGCLQRNFPRDLFEDPPTACRGWNRTLECCFPSIQDALNVDSFICPGTWRNNGVNGR